MGSPIDAETVQYVVSFRKDNEHFCTGCLVSAKDVLTAGYCVYKIREFQKDTNVSETAAFVNEKKYEIARTNMCIGYNLTYRCNNYNLGHVEVSVLMTY